VIGRLSLFSVLALLFWLACRLIFVWNWNDRAYWRRNVGIGACATLFALITAFVMWADPQSFYDGIAK
jgi:hypothetical protein